MSVRRQVNLSFVFTIALAYLLMLMQLPPALAPWKPYWLGLAVIYWGLEDKQRVGLGRVFILGLVADLLTGNLLGEQALRLVALAFIVARFRPRLRFFTMGQQTLAVLALLFNDRILLLMVRAFAGDSWPPPQYWLGPFAGAMLWPFVFLLLDDLRSRARARE